MSFFTKLIYAPIITTTEVEKFIDGAKLVKKRLAKPKDPKRQKDAEIYRKSFLENTKKFLKENPKQVLLWILCILAAPLGVFITCTFLRDLVLGRIGFWRGLILFLGIYLCASAFHNAFRQIGEELWRIDVKGFNAVKKARKKAADKAKREAEEAAAKAKKAKEEAQAKEKAQASPASPEGTSETAEPTQPATEGTSETTDSDSETNAPESAAEASDATNNPDDPNDADAPNDGWLVYDDPDDEEEYFLD